MPTLTKNNKETIIHLLCARIVEPIAIYLFGSMAANTVHDSSDIDLAFLPQESLSNVLRWDIQQELADALGKAVDLVDLRVASTVMRLQVVTTGEVLYEGDSTKRAEFEMLALSMYARLNEERREILDQVKREGRVYG